MNRLLVIDDDPAWRALYSMAFEDQFELIEAGDAREALAMLRDVSPDVIVLDLRMPRMSGLDFIRALDHEGIRIPIVVCSGVVAAGEPLSVPGVRVAPKVSDLRELRAALRDAAPHAAAGAASAPRAGAVADDTYWRD
jgi:CheY-like chemotaxis protein